MQSVANLLSPEQVQFILSTYDSIEAWASQIVTDFGDAASIVIEDVMI